MVPRHRALAPCASPGPKIEVEIVDTAIKAKRALEPKLVTAG